MHLVAVLYVLGWVLAIIAGAMLIPAVFAVAVGSIVQVQAFVVPAFAVGFIAGCMIIAFKNRQPFAGRRQSLLLLVLVWTVVPVAAAVPFYVLGFPHTVWSAYFEAASGFTTTGATTLKDLGQTPASILVWRALLQWIGGLVTLISLATLLGPLSGTVIDDRQLRLIGHTAEGTMHHMREALRSFLPLYSALTAACFISLSGSGISTFDAFCLSLATLSTGGFMPRDGTIILYGSPLAELSLALFMTIGACSVIWIRAIMQMRWTIVRETREPLWIFCMVGILGLWIAAMLVIDIGGYRLPTIVHSLTLGLASAASLLTTTGFAVSEQTYPVLPYMAVLCLCMIGGGRFSTAGGLKVYRIAFLMRLTAREIRLLIYPHGVRPSSHGAEALDVEVAKGLWIMLTAFVLVVGALSMFVAWSGVPFGGAVMAAVGSVTNIGQIYEFSRITDFTSAPDFAAMNPAAQIALCVGMVFGRMEILALLTVFNSVFWRD
jgi:trk system potassium uptake protein TrkH